MLPSWQQLPRLPLPDGKSLSVRTFNTANPDCTVQSCSVYFFIWLCFTRSCCPHTCASGMWWAVWRCWSRRITWSSTWMEERPGVKCPALAGLRSAIRWSTEGMETVISFMQMHYIEEFILNLFPQTEEKPKISDHHSPFLVYPDSPRDFQTLHQVNMDKYA